LNQTSPNETQLFGNLDETKFKNIQNNISLSFKMSINHAEDWEKCSMVSNFFADYHTSSVHSNKNEIKSTISTITNELIENAIKHTYKNYSDISLHLTQLPNEAIITTENITNKENKDNLCHTIKQLSNTNLEGIILSRIKNNLIYNQKNSEIGLLNIINSFSANLGAKISPIDNTKLFKIELIVSIKYE
tara:strand:- start:8515 stop:9084 length:570 start_codon:yes stop_codon:yes gene_type:complete